MTLLIRGTSTRRFFWIFTAATSRSFPPPHLASSFSGPTVSATCFARSRLVRISCSDSMIVSPRWSGEVYFDMSAPGAAGVLVSVTT